MNLSRCDYRYGCGEAAYRRARDLPSGVVYDGISQLGAMMIGRRTLLALPPALLLAAGAGAAPAGMLRWDGGYLLLRVQVNGRPADALLDFNAHGTLLDRHHATALGVDDANTKVVIDAAGQHFGAMAVTMADLTDFANFTLRGRIGLVLGRDLFAAAPFLLDLRTPAIAALSQPSARAGRALAFTSRFGIETVPVTIDGISAQAALDLHDMGSMRVSAAFAARAGLERARRRPGTSGANMLRTMAIGKFEIAGHIFTDVEVALDASDHAPDAWLNPSILRHFHMAVDLPTRMLWLEPV